MNDFLRNNDDLSVDNGDLVVGDSTRQHQVDIIKIDKGWNHFQPACGVGLAKYLADTEGVVGLRLAIRNELEKDGQVVERVQLQKGAIQIEAYYD